MSLMKKSIILIGCMVLGLTSCYKSVLDPLEGKFPAPTRVNATQVTATAEKLDAYHLFSLDLQEGGNAVHLALAGEKYYLPANTYIEAEEAAARKGNFILGKTTVNGTRVRSGKVVVAHTPIDEIKNHYDISAVLFLDNGDPYTLSWSGDLDFYPDPVEGDIVVRFTVDKTGLVRSPQVVNVTSKTPLYFEFYAAPGTTGLVGSYTCIEYAENNPDGWVVSNGWSFPDWGIAGGSHYVTGGKQTDLAVGDVVNVTPIGEGMYSFMVSSGFSVLVKVQ